VKECLSRLFEEVLKSLHTLRLRDQKGFRAWARAIYQRIRSDAIKEKIERERSIYIIDFSRLESKSDEKENQIFSQDKAIRKEISERIVEQSEEKMRRIYEQMEAGKLVKILEEMKKEGDECAEFLLSWYEWLIEDLSQKEMAQKMHMKENTFNQKLKRCKNHIKEKLLKN